MDVSAFEFSNSSVYGLSLIHISENINVFQDSMNLCKNNDRIRESLHKSAEGQKLILEGDAIAEPAKKRYKEKAQITVSTKRTFEAASAYKGTKTAVHNFASVSYTHLDVYKRQAQEQVQESVAASGIKG